MRILFVDFTLPYLLKDSEYPVGGFAVQLGNWINALILAGETVGVLSFNEANRYVNKTLDFELIDTYDPNKGAKVLKYFYSYIPKLICGAKQFKPDVIIQACAGVNTGIMAFVALVCGVPFIYRVANDMDVDGRCHNRLKQYEQYCYYYGLKRSTAIICQNQYQYDCLKERYPSKSLHVVHNPYDTTRVVNEILPRAERNYVAWLGVFSHQKNLSLLLSIAKELPSIQFRVAGMPTTSLDKDTAKALEQLQLLENVKFVGYVKRGEVLPFLGGAIALLSTSHYEGFSNTFLEAFAAGTPVIAPYRIDPDLIITKNSLGFTSKEDGKLTDGIMYLIGKSADDYDVITTKCQNFLLDNFHPKVKAEELVKILSVGA
ncbi:MAG: glycosyltransferase family 4 protein [Oceanospirillaceae bacterium]|nr:glycosyltransferase family 4 protein [Oceanospirillaceae bacterium]